jgi:phage tail sheath gpL-like
LTAKNSGTNGNKIPIGVDFSDVTGINIVTVQMAGGATDPTLQEGLDALEGTDIRHIVTQFNDATNLGTLESSLRADAEPLSGVFRFGYAAESFVTVAAVSSLANGVDYQRVNIAYSRNTAEEQRGKYIDYEIAAGYAATYIKIDDPAQPRNGEIIGGMPTPAFNNYLNSVERQTLLENGVSALITEGNDVQILRSVTTKTTTNSVKDFNLLDQQKQDSLDFVASSVKAMFKINYRQVKGTPAVLSRMRSSVLAVLYDLEEQEIVVNVKANESGVIVKQAVGFAVGTVSVSIPAQIVDGVHVIDQNIILISL